VCEALVRPVDTTLVLARDEKTERERERERERENMKRRHVYGHARILDSLSIQHAERLIVGDSRSDC